MIDPRAESGREAESARAPSSVKQAVAACAKSCSRTSVTPDFVHRGAAATPVERSARGGLIRRAHQLIGFRDSEQQARGRARSAWAGVVSCPTADLRRARAARRRARGRRSGDSRLGGATSTSHSGEGSACTDVYGRLLRTRVGSTTSLAHRGREGGRAGIPLGLRWRAREAHQPQPTHFGQARAHHVTPDRARPHVTVHFRVTRFQLVT